MKKIVVIFVIMISLVSGIVVYASNSVDSSIKMNEDVTETIEKQENDIKETKAKKIKVDIKGEVVNPGVYELEENARVIDAINMAGGLNEQADTDAINLSKILKDENVIVIYNLNSQTNNIEEYKRKVDACLIDYNDACINGEIVNSTNNSSNKEIEESKDNNSDSKAKENQNQVININQASLEQLTSLSGIGVSKAQKIIDYRNNNGSFKTIEDIKNVSGIGDSVFEKIKNYITV